MGTVEIREEEAQEEFKVYGRRYAILATVVVLNISNAALWINYSTISTTAAEFHETSTVKINFFSAQFMITSFVTAFIATYVVDTVGLRVGIHVGAALNCSGSIIRAIGTMEFIGSKDAQYAISAFGQELAAIAQSFILFISTKVSQVWFPEDQRAVATTISAMSNPLGIVIAEIVSPTVVKSPEDVPLNNVIWMVFGIVAEVLAIVCVTRAKPTLPPSRSAMQGEVDRPSYSQQLKNAFTTAPFWLLMLVLGGGIGLFSAIATLAEQMLCPMGYTDGFAGLSIALMVLLGFVGSGVTGVYVDRTKKFTEITKLFFGFACISAIIMFEFFLVPGQPALVALSSGLFGFFGVGAYPVGLELAVETTFPVEESISTAFVFLAGQITGVVIVILVPLAARPLPPDMENLSECSSESDTELLDYTYPLIGVMIYLCIIVSVLIIFFKTKYKRLEAEIKRHSIGGDESLKESY